MSHAGTLKAALRLLRDAADKGLWLHVVGTLLLVASGGALAALSPWVLKDLVDSLAPAVDGIHAPDHRAVLQQGAMYLLVLVAGRVVADIRPLLAGKVEQQALAVLRQRFVEHLFQLPIQYVLHCKAGELLHRVDLASAGLQLIVSHLAHSIVPVAVELILMGVILAHLQQGALIALFFITAIGYGVIFAIGATRLSRRAGAVSAASLDVHAQITDAITNHEVLRCFGATAQTASGLQFASGRLASSWAGLHRMTLNIGMAASALFALALAACLAITTDAAFRGEMTVGGIVLAMAYMLQMMRPLEVMGSATRDVTRALSFMRPLMELLGEPADPNEMLSAASCSAAPESTKAPALRFENVDFGYDASRPVLRNLNLNLDLLPGRMTAIVGRSGSGKSSIIRLLLRLYAPQSGRILLDDRPLDTMPVAGLRRLISLVPQDAGLLHASAADNIALGMPGTRREDIEQVARAVLLHAVIDALPEGYDTPLGERSQMLSGGERQRLAIARGLLRNSVIYLLDEPTSMLDLKTEAVIMENLRQLTQGRTTLLIAHRLSTVRQADDIVVLEGGQVGERGTHEELLAKDGLYAQLWRQQASAAA